MMTPGEFAARLRWAAVRAKNELDIPTEAVVEHAAKEAKAAIGTYEYGWPQLAESTQAERQALGYPPNDPLLREGDLRNSIKSKTQLSISGAEGLVYSDDKIAVYQELGTSRGIPPRSFLMTSLVRSDGKLEEAFTAFMESLFL